MRKFLKCVSCGQILVGRSDKKYCDDHCRSTYNNKINSITNSTMRNTNYALRKNRRILEYFFAGSTLSEVSLNKLINKGYNFVFHTHMKTDEEGDKQIFCYDCGLKDLGKGKYKIYRSDFVEDEWAF